MLLGGIKNLGRIDANYNLNTIKVAGRIVIAEYGTSTPTNAPAGSSYATILTVTPGNQTLQLVNDLINEKTWIRHGDDDNFTSWKEL